MSYSYEREKARLFTDEGRRMFLAIRDETQRLLAVAGSARADKMMAAAHGGDSWLMLAAIDRMIELGEIRDVSREGAWGQYRVFVATKGPYA